MSKYKKLIKDTFIFALGSIGSKAIVFFLVPLYTNVLTSEQYGTADLVLTFSQLLMPLVCLAVYNAIIRFGLANKDNPENTLLVGLIIWLSGCLVLFLCLPVVSLYKPIAPWKWYLYLHVGSSILFVIAQNYLKVKNQNLKYSIVSILQIVMLAGLNILLLVVYKVGIKGYLLSNVFASFGAAIIAVLIGGIISDVRKARFDKGLLIQMIKYSSPLILNNIAWWVIQSSDKIMIEAYVGTTALGLYTVATRIPSLINVIISVFQEAWNISSIVEMDSSNDSDFYSNVFQLYTVVVFFACIGINAIVKPFMKIYVGEDFYEAWKFVPLLVVSAAAFSAVAAFYGSMYGALKKSLSNMFSTLIAALVNIVMNYFLIHYIGVLGAVLGTFISYLVLEIVRMIDVGQYVKIRIDYKIYVINCILLIVDAVFITYDICIYIVSIIVMIIFLIINRKAIKVYWNKSIDMVKKRE